MGVFEKASLRRLTVRKARNRKGRRGIRRSERKRGGRRGIASRG